MTTLLNYDEFALRLLNTFEKQEAGSPIKAVTIDKFNALISLMLDQHKQRDELIVPFDSIYLTGGEVIINGSDVAVRWSTAFYPYPRYKQSTASVIPLGWYNEYDLYIGLQEGLPPTLMARHGDNGEDYHSFNPTLNSGVVIDECIGHHFVEAYKRARLIYPDIHTTTPQTTPLDSFNQMVARRLAHRQRTSDVRQTVMRRRYDKGPLT